MPKKYRILIFACAAVYIAAYVGRLSYAASMVGILNATGATKGDAGLVSTFFYFTYGCGQLVNAFLCRYYKPRPVIAGVLTVAALSNLLVFLIQDVTVVKYVWLVNGAAQSMLWCTLIELLSRRLPQEYMTKATVAMSATVSIGTTLAYGIAALCIRLGQVFITFVIAAAVLAAVAVLWVLCTRVLRDMPDSTAENPGKPASSFGLLAGMGALIAVTGALAIGNGLLKDTMTTWIPTLMYEEFGVPEAYSVIITLILPLTSLLGATLVILIRRFVASYTKLMGLLYAVTALSFCGVLLAWRAGSILLTILCFALNACLMAGVNNIITFLIPMEQKNGSGMFAGIMDAFCYVGSTLSGFLPGLIIDAGGFAWLLPCLPIAAILFAAAAFLGGIRRKKSA